MFRCSCSGNHILVVDKDDDFTNIWIAADGGIKPSFFVRIKNAYKALINSHHYDTHDVVFFDDEKDRLKKFL